MAPCSLQQSRCASPAPCRGGSRVPRDSVSRIPDDTSNHARELAVSAGSSAAISFIVFHSRSTANRHSSCPKYSQLSSACTVQFLHPCSVIIGPEIAHRRANYLSRRQCRSSACAAQATEQLSGIEPAAGSPKLAGNGAPSSCGALLVVPGVALPPNLQHARVSLRFLKEPASADGGHACWSHSLLGLPGACTAQLRVLSRR